MHFPLTVAIVTFTSFLVTFISVTIQWDSRCRSFHAFSFNCYNSHFHSFLVTFIGASFSSVISRHSYYGFPLCGTKWLSQNFDPLTLGKMSVGGGLGALQFFWSPKKGTRTFSFPLE